MADKVFMVCGMRIKMEDILGAFIVELKAGKIRCGEQFLVVIKVLIS